MTSLLSALPALLAIVPAIGAARPGPAIALTITPAAHDFDKVVVGAPGTAFQFTIALPPGGGPGDSVVATVTGPDAGSFLLGTMTVMTATGSRPYTTCTTSAWRSGSCSIGVEFIPHALGVKNATLTVSDTRGNRGTATLTGTGIAGCVMYEGICNYAANYTGGFGWKSAVSTSYTGFSSVATVNVDVTLRNGVVLCHGAQSATATSTEKKVVTTGVVSGPGVLVVEFKQSNGKREYQITAACPSAEITQTITDYDDPSLSGTSTLSAKPANWSRRESIDGQLAAGDIGDLVGTQTFPHPEQDPDNGVTGTMTFTWSLKRN